MLPQQDVDARGGVSVGAVGGGQHPLAVNQAAPAPDETVPGAHQTRLSKVCVLNYTLSPIMLLDRNKVAVSPANSSSTLTYENINSAFNQSDIYFRIGYLPGVLRHLRLLAAHNPLGALGQPALAVAARTSSWDIQLNIGVRVQSFICKHVQYYYYYKSVQAKMFEEK